MDSLNLDRLRVVVLIPCYNEETTIAKVVQDFGRVLPGAEVYVIDNNSCDDSAARALAAGAKVIREKKQGKGFVVASTLSQIDADYYIMVDGDDTYPADRALDLLIPLVNEEADMVVGSRLQEFSDNAFRPLHVVGNQFVCRLINLVFRAGLTDVMSGYRALNRELAENLPVVASGFDVETEMTLQTLYRGFKIKEVLTPYRERGKGSASKLRTFHDGFSVLFKILGVVAAYKPLTSFGGLGLLLFLIGMLLGGYVLAADHIQYEPVGLFAVAGSIACALVGTVLVSIGLVLHILNFRILEITSVLAKQHVHIRNCQKNG